MLEDIQNYTSYALMAAGAFFMLSGALGILRMKDFFSRMHPAGVADSFGAPLILLGAIVHYGFTIISAKIFFLTILLLVTNPTTAHILAQAAVAAGLKPMVRDKK